MKHWTIVFATLCAVSLSFAGEVYNLAAQLRAEREIDNNGFPLRVTGTTGDFNGLSVGRLFDGNTYQASNSPMDNRWMVCMFKHGAGNVYAQLAASESFRPNKAFVLKKYRLFRGSYWRQDGRDVKQWKIYGIPEGAGEDASRWVLLAEQTSDYVYPSYSASETNEFAVTASGDALVGFRAFRFVPMSTSHYVKNVADGKATNTYDLDMREVEFDVEEVDRPARIPMRFIDYLSQRGGSASSYYEKQNMYATLDRYSSFDGDRTTGDDGTFRCLGYMGKEGGVYVGLNLATCRERLSGDTFYLGGYRIYTLFGNGNEKARAPLAWTVQAKVGADELDIADTRVDVDWSGVSFFSANINFLAFSPEAAIPFDHVRFVPTESAASQSGVGGSNINVGWMELDLYVCAANEKGTLRVLSGKFGGTGFTPEADALVSEATTLTAPASIRVGDDMFAVTGHYLESFDFASGRWLYKSGSYAETRSYAYVPDPDKAERLVWIVSDSLTSAGVTVSEGSCVGKESVTGTGLYGIGDVVTVRAFGSPDDLTASSSETNLFHSTFVRWEGDLEGLDINPSSAVLSFTLDRSRVLKPVFARDWLLYSYDKSNEGGDGTECRMKNGVWEFAVNAIAADTHKLVLSSNGYRSGQGILDFAEGRILCPGDVTPYVVREIENRVMGIDGNSPVSERKTITELILPPTLECLGDGTFRTQEAMTRLVADCPLLDLVRYTSFTRDTSLKDVSLNLPLAGEIRQWAFFNVPLSQTDAALWNLSAVTNIGYQAFYMEGNVQVIPRSAGTLELPALQSLGEGAFQYNGAFAEMRLGTTNRNLSAIGPGAFYGCGVTNVVFGSDESLTVNSTAFMNVNGETGLRGASFTSVPPKDRSAVDNILQTNDLTRVGYEATLSLPRAKRRQWEGYVTSVADIVNEAVKAAAEAREADGVWISCDGMTYKAYVKYVGPADPGLLMIVK